MNKIKTSLKNLRSDITSFYDSKEIRFLTVNGLDTGDKLEIQWIFSRYGVVDDITLFYVEIDYEDEIPSLSDIIKSAWVSEYEIRDLLGAKFENAESGLFLESDREEIPLRKSNV